MKNNKRKRNDNRNKRSKRSRTENPRRNPMRVVTNIVKRYGIGLLGSSSSAETLTGYNFTVNSVEDITSWAAVFDMYRITKVEFEILPASALPIPTGTLPACYMVAAIDYDDSAAESTVARVLNYQNAVIIQPGKSLKRSFTPRCANALYSGAFTSYGSVASPWIDCSSLTVEHYGVKVGITQSTSSNAHGWHIFATLHIDFASPR